MKILNILVTTLFFNFAVVNPTEFNSYNFSIEDTTILNVGIHPMFIEETKEVETVKEENKSDICTKLYKQIPENVRIYLENENWTYQLVSRKKLNKLSNQTGVIGYTDIQNHIIYIEDDIISVKRAFLHEYGHAIGVSITKGQITLLQEQGISDEYLDFNNIYTNEKNDFVYSYRSTDKHETSNLAEYLASTFHEYITNPKVLNSTCPKTFMFWDNILQTF